MIIAALLIASQVPYVGLEQDRKAFEPYRQCVLRNARHEYSSAKNLKLIFESASEKCIIESATAAADMALNAAQRAIEAAAKGRTGGEGGDRWAIFERELLFELAADFQPKVQ